MLVMACISKAAAFFGLFVSLQGYTGAFRHGLATTLQLQQHSRGLLSTSSTAVNTANSSNAAAPSTAATSNSTAAAMANSTAAKNATIASAGHHNCSLGELEAKIKDDIEGIPEQHSKATEAIAATLGSLLLVSMVGCAGFLIYKRFNKSRHTGSSRKAHNDWSKHYEADKIFGDLEDL